MNIIVISILAIVALGIIVMIGTRIFDSKGTDEPIVVPASDCSSCDGTNVKCEQVCQMEAATKPAEYYDDEELDAFRGRRSDEYNDEEATMFAEVLETLRPDEVRPWSRSLIVRGINMPDQIKDEFIALAEG
jgi:epoxyqueuosine reductase QueG